MSGADKLIQVATAEVGYLEKKSNKNLDGKTANAGSGNYTKYNRDLLKWAGVGSLNAQWCQAFVCWCFIMAFGLEMAKKLIYSMTNYTPTGSGAFKKRGRYIKRGHGTPKPGDVVYFYSKSKGRIGHVGIVYKVSGSTVYTIEGNTSGASALVTNGGGVRKKSYNMGTTYIDGYGSVDYGALEGAADPASSWRELRVGDTGADVKAMQQALMEQGYSFPRYGADGEFGSETEANVKGFQRASGLPVTGVFDADTRAALVARMAREVEITGPSVNVRSGPGTQYAILGVVHRGDRLPYGGQLAGGWLLVEFQGKNGAISPKYGRLVE